MVWINFRNQEKLLQAEQISSQVQSKSRFRVEQKIDSATSTLTGGASRLSANSGTLNSGASQLASGSTATCERNRVLCQVEAHRSRMESANLPKGAKELSDGTKEFNDKGIKKLDEAVNDDLQDVLDRLDALRSDEKCIYKLYRKI